MPDRLQNIGQAINFVKFFLLAKGVFKMITFMHPWRTKTKVMSCSVARREHSLCGTQATIIIIPVICVPVVIIIAYF